MASREELLARRKQANMFHPASNIVEQTKDMILDTPLSELVKDVNNTINSAKDNPDQVFKAKANEFVPFPEESIRLKLHTGYKRESMVESIKKDGIMLPILVWLHEGEKIILSGHNRVDIARELDIEIPYIIMKDISYEKARRIVVIQNLYNRQHIEMSKSELSNMLVIAIGSYNDTVSKSQIYKDLEKEFYFTRKQVLAYLRIQKLHPELMQFLDEDKMPMDAAYNIAGVDNDKQSNLVDFLKVYSIHKITMKNANYLINRKVGDWDEDFMKAAFGLVEKSKRGRKLSSIKISCEDLTSFIPESQLKKAPEIIKESLQLKNDLEQIFKNNSCEYDEGLIKSLLENHFSD